MGYYLFVYSPSDFKGGLPAESGGAASGSGEFELTLTSDAQPTIIEVIDDDSTFNEIDWSQDVAEDTDLDGTQIAAGTSVHSAYDLINTDSGHQITTLHFGGSGYEQGAVHGLVSTEPMQAGHSYKFDVERSSYRQDNEYQDYVACFAADTLIYCQGGPLRAGDIVAGDRVLTLDDGLQTVRWAGQVTVPARGPFAPIEIAPRRLGNRRELRVSPQHRLLVRDPRLECIAGLGEGLVAAKHLIDGKTVRRRPGGLVTYVHFYFDQHQIVFAEGALAESFLPEPMALAGLPAEARGEFLALFPQFAAPSGAGKCPARPILTRREALVLID